MTTCVISQPRFFPGLHYLHRMMVADVFVILDTVQFNPRHEENRARIKGPAGPQWLTVPMRQLGRDQRIIETRTDNGQAWRRKLIGTLLNLYGPARCYRRYSEEIISILDGDHEPLTELDHASWAPAIRLLGISCRFLRASDLAVSGKGSELLLEICRQVGATTYLSGGAAKEYLDPALFESAGVQVSFHTYEYPEYSQRHGPFIPFLSYLDMLFNVGLERATVLEGGRQQGP